MCLTSSPATDTGGTDGTGGDGGGTVFGLIGDPLFWCTGRLCCGQGQ